MEIRENVEISTLTTMRIGGLARFVVEIKNDDDVKEAWKFAKENDLPIWMMGGGANTIGKDEGFDGIIFLNEIGGLTVDGEEIMGGGGVIWDDVVKLACENGLSGIEAMTAIPGTLGAAPVQNIGAYGQDISQVFESARVFDLERGEFKELKRDEMNFEYRHSILNYGETAGRYFVTEVTLKLSHNGLKPPFYTSLQRYVDENKVTDFSPMNIRKMVGEIRASKLPDPKTIASAGSFFKNIYVKGDEYERAKELGIPMWQEEDGSYKINSGWLIENAGIKGKVFHGFKVSDKAALILINENGKSYSELEAAKDEIIKVVEEKFGFKMEMEPVILK